MELTKILRGAYNFTMPQGQPPPACPHCHKPMRLMLDRASHDRKYKCIDCDGDDPIQSHNIGALLRAKELQPPKGK